VFEHGVVKVSPLFTTPLGLVVPAVPPTVTDAGVECKSHAPFIQRVSLTDKTPASQLSSMSPSSLEIVWEQGIDRSPPLSSCDVSWYVAEKIPVVTVTPRPVAHGFGVQAAALAVRTLWEQLVTMLFMYPV
jgi:hypothetical protein